MSQTADPLHLPLPTLEAGLPEILESPRDDGTVEMIVRRPAIDQREVLEEATLDPAYGVVGDDWRVLVHRRDESGSPDTQLTLMNSRAVALLAGGRERWSLAGDQLYVDFDLSDDNLPPGTRLAIGEAIIETTAEAHNGCKKFARRYGVDAVKFVNSPVGKRNHLRGIYAKVVQSGVVRQGDRIRKVASGAQSP